MRILVALMAILIPSTALATDGRSVFLHCDGLKNQRTGDTPDPINVEVDANGRWLRPGAGSRIALYSRDPNLWNYGDWTKNTGTTISFMPDDLGLMIHPSKGDSRVFYCVPFDNPFIHRE